MGININVDRTLDLQGEACPYPPIYTLEELNDMKPGEVLEVIVDHPPSVTNVPEEVIRNGHQVLFEPVRDGAVFHLYFQVAKK
ncbi:sulfurtransferase-like selenium metabolism protein YedF [Rossellomorea sp. BNER]|jgi:TusA-related sulfurtransferase|uniref:sulfurtransferase-like selenium metabolism protein YedF n=1 Tax=Rossellomorea sp. BNER TaxID=2962031 RepID=UPI003AF2F0B5|nr:sulfurtransferase-like selenium metabolism protein YedF [Rossellomorea sp. BNER]